MKLENNSLELLKFLLKQLLNHKIKIEIIKYLENNNLKNIMYHNNLKTTAKATLLRKFIPLRTCLTYNKTVLRFI